MSAQTTDCRTETGITVGLIDGIIAIARMLAHRDLTAPQAHEALKDMRSDEDVRRILGAAASVETATRLEQIAADRDEIAKAEKDRAALLAAGGHDDKYPMAAAVRWDENETFVHILRSLAAELREVNQ